MLSKKFILFTAVIFSLLIQKTLFSQSSFDHKNLETVINLTKFIKWSDQSSRNFTNKIIYVITDDKVPYSYEIKTSSKFNYKNWQVVCSKTINNISPGSIIFLMTKKNEKIKKIIKISKAKDILTISNDIDGFCLIGGMINIKEKSNSQKFEINYKEIQNKNMQISSKLLALAKIYD